MKIDSFKKLKNGIYELVLDKVKYSLHEDLILKYELLLTREVSLESLAMMQEENQYYLAYEVALKAIKNRQRSKAELEGILSKKGYSDSITDHCVEKLESQGYVSDRMYAESYLHDKMLMSYDGPYKIAQELRKNGIEEEIISSVLSAYTKEMEEEKLTKLVDKAIKTNRNKSEKSLLQKIQLRLVQQGFSRDLVAQQLSHHQVDDTEVKKREYEKLYQKLSKKYQGKELEMKLKQKMYQKGFSFHE